jgi:uncharacterized phiE125 gp8 family phage protein
MGLKLITSPGAEPLTLAEVKAHLRITHSSDDAMLAIYLAAARQWIDGPDGWLNRAIMLQTWELSLDTFPSAEIRLPLIPVKQIDSIKYDDSNGAEQTMPPGDYFLDNPAHPSWVLPYVGTGWPSTMATANAVRVRFICGYDTAAVVPATLKAAVLLMTGYLYEHREATVEDAFTAGAVRALLNPYQMIIE